MRTFIIHDYARMGELIRAWADGSEPPPNTIGELKKLVEPGKIATLGISFSDVEPIQYAKLLPNAKALSFVIPAAEDISGPLPAGSWPLPEFYSLLAFGKQPVTVAEDETSRKAFRSSRIADYSASKCM